MKAKMLVLSMFFILSSLISACSKNDVRDNILSVPMGSSKVESTIAEFMQDTCPKNELGYCKVIGE